MPLVWCHTGLSARGRGGPGGPGNRGLSAAGAEDRLQRLVAGTEEPFFLENANRWANALRDAGAEVVMRERAGDHGGGFWFEEFPLMLGWAFER